MNGLVLGSTFGRSHAVAKGVPSAALKARPLAWACPAHILKGASGMWGLRDWAQVAAEVQGQG